MTPRTHVHLLGRSVSAFQVCGVAGFAVANVVAFGLVAARGLRPGVMAGLVVLAVATFLGLALVTKRVVGEERLVCYHAQLAVCAVTAGVLSAAGQPVLPYLDATLLGVGAFVAGGRLGCYLVGCCHGGPARDGVRYGTSHADAGFPAYLVGVPLRRVQLAEAAFVTASVVAGLVSGHGTVVYAIGYATGRYAVEAWRGDVRPVWRGLSEAQWTSLLVVAAVTVAEPVAAVLLVALVAAAPFAARRNTGLGNARHVRELATALDAVAAPGPEPVVAATSRGVLVSAHGRSPRVYTVSRRDGALSDDDALALAELVVRLRDPDARWHVVRGSLPVFHVVAS